MEDAPHPLATGRVVRSIDPLVLTKKLLAFSSDTCWPAASSQGGGVARACAGHTDSGGATSTYVRASLSEVAGTVAALTSEPHPLAAAEGWRPVTCSPGRPLDQGGVYMDGLADLPILAGGTTGAGRAIACSLVIPVVTHRRRP